MLTVKILGSGCPNCKRVEAVARQAAAKAGIEAEFIKVTDINDINRYPILSTPGLVINEKVVSAGRIPKESDVIAWLKSALEPTNLSPL
jgi:small redox-active disulfide protein 2